MDAVNPKIEKHLIYCDEVLRSRRLNHFTAPELLSFCARFLKIEEAYHSLHGHRLTRCRIALLASTTVHHLALMLRGFLVESGIMADVYVAPFDSINSEVMNPTSELYRFKPDIVILIPQNNGASSFPSLTSDQAEFDAWVLEWSEHQRTLWSRVSEIHTCQIIQCLSPAPAFRYLGNLEAFHPRSPRQCLRALEAQLIRLRPPNVTFFDLDYLASWMGHDRWLDEVNFFISKQPMSFDGAKMVAHGLSKLIGGYCGKIRKCLVLDLDNTLWGGVVGDDGLDGIVLGNGDPVGEAFMAFQKYIKSLGERGVLLAVCSKNEDALARAPFSKHPEMILKEDDIVSFVANWDDKAANLRRIARDLNIGLDALVFFDDNPAERELVRQFAPEVEVIDVPEDPALFVRTLDRAMAFERTELTREDLNRSQSYRAEGDRRRLQSGGDYAQYLVSLEMSASVGPPRAIDLGRFTQLINKSNQFNLRTRRYSDAAISAMISRPADYALIAVHLKDRFSDYGLISCMILERREHCAFIDTWVMSCRVLKRDVEHAVFNAALDISKNWGCLSILGEYIPTEKNDMVSKLLPSLGFAPETTSTTQSIFYRLPAARFQIKPHTITILESHLNGH